MTATPRSVGSTSAAVAFAAVALLLGVPASAQATGTETGAPALTVSPERTLFDVKLYPGDQALANATLHNQSNTLLRVGLTPQLIDWRGSPEAFDSLTLASRATADCSAAEMASAPAISMSSAQYLDQGTVSPGESVEICLQVAYPMGHEVQQPGTVVANFSFTGIQYGGEDRGGNSGDGILAGTGITGGNVLGLALAGLALTALGSAALRRRRACTPEQTMLRVE